MLTELQLQERTQYMGASDAAGILGLSRWSSPLSVWAEKTGEVPKEDISGKLFVKLGHLLEDDMTEIFEEETGKKLHRVTQTQYHAVHKFIAANLDRRVVGENVPVELKTANAYKVKEWEGEEIPREYILQCMHTLMVTEKPYMYLGVLIGSQDFQIKRVERDEDLITEILAREVAFWKGFVEPRIMPKVVTRFDGDTLEKLYPVANEGDVIELTDEANILIENLQGFKADKKNLEGLIDKTENQLKMLLGKHEGGVTSLHKVMWKNSQQSRLDGKGLLKDLPMLHAKYYKTETCRRFCVSNIDGGK